MSAVRETVKRFEYEINPRSPFHEELPTFCDVAEPNVPIQAIWTDFSIAVSKLYETKQSRGGSKREVLVAFHSGMKSLCADFSRRTENIKLEYNAKETPPRVMVIQLSEVPDSIRNDVNFERYTGPENIPEPRGVEKSPKLDRSSGSRNHSSTGRTSRGVRGIDQYLRRRTTRNGAYPSKRPVGSGTNAASRVIQSILVRTRTPRIPGGGVAKASTPVHSESSDDVHIPNLI